MPKKTANISTVRATPEKKREFQKVIKEKGFSSMAHFFRHVMETFLNQVALDHDLVWPLRFERKKQDKTSGNKRSEKASR